MTLDELLPQAVRETLPPLRATEGDPDPLCRVKFFYPDFSWTWYGIEFDGDDIFFGFVDGFAKELGSFRLSELLENRGKCSPAGGRVFKHGPSRRRRKR